MDSDKTLPRIVSSDEIWKDVDGPDGVVFSHTAIIAFKGDIAYHGTTTARDTDIDMEAIVKDLKPIPREDIYPKFTSHLTRAPGIYTKTPDLEMYSPDRGKILADLLLHEAEIYEILRKHPHPNLGQSLGCVVADDGRITGLALVKYDSSTLFERAYDPEAFGEEKRSQCIERLKDAVQHLHDLGLAHNDLNPTNVMFTDDEKPVLVDFDTCHPIGTELVKGGQVGDWETGIPVAVYKSSSAACDKASIDFISAWLKRKYDENKSKNDSSKDKVHSSEGALEGTSAKGNEECIETSDE